MRFDVRSPIMQPVADRTLKLAAPACVVVLSDWGLAWGSIGWYHDAIYGAKALVEFTSAGTLLSLFLFGASGCFGVGGGGWYPCCLLVGVLVSRGGSSKLDYERHQQSA